MLTAATIEAMREQVRAGKGNLILMVQNPANYHYWSKAVASAEQEQWLEILDLAAMAARIRER